MNLGDVSLSIAFGAGFLSFFSPCILPLIPVYIMYITGISMENELKSRRLFALKRTIGFVQCIPDILIVSLFFIQYAPS